jgi:Domain of unknown function (DUF6438)
MMWMRAWMTALCLWSAVAGADASAPMPSPRAGGAVRVMATLQRTACLGTCPVYKLTIYSDGRVEWKGEYFVKVKGKASARLDAGALALLKAAFDRARFLELGDGFDCYEATDMPSADVSYDDGKRHKEIRHYHGCISKPDKEKLFELEGRIDEIAHTERWMGTQLEREQLRKSGKY